MLGATQYGRMFFISYFYTETYYSYYETYYEISFIISSLDSNKSSGSNSIPVKILKLLKNDISQKLSDIFNVFRSWAISLSPENS